MSFNIGDEVEHKLTNWPGIVVVDLKHNEFTSSSEDWGVKFLIEDKVAYRVVSQHEIKHKDKL